MKDVDRLALMMGLQREFQVQMYCFDYKDLTDGQRIGFFTDSYIALIHELGEAHDEMGWKPWATSRHFNTPRVRSELIDAWHFLINLFLLADMTPADVLNGYMAKQRINRKRQADGYDGVTTKCPMCRSAYDDEGGELCYPASRFHPGWCQKAKAQIPQRRDKDAIS